MIELAVQSYLECAQMEMTDIKKKVRDAVQSALVEVFEGNADSTLTYVEGIKLEDALVTLLAPMINGDPSAPTDHAIEVIDKLRSIVEDPHQDVGATLLDIGRHLDAFELRFRTSPERAE